MRTEVLSLLADFGEKTEYGSIILANTSAGEVLIILDNETLIVEDPETSARYISWEGSKELPCAPLPDLKAVYTGLRELKQVQKILQEIRDQFLH